MARRGRAQKGAGRRIKVGAPACRQDEGRVQQQALDHPALATTEFRFAMLLEDFLDRQTGRFLDFLVAIAEGGVKRLGQLAADRRLAGAHQTDQRNGFRQKLGRLLRFGNRPPLQLWRRDHDLPCVTKQTLILDAEIEQLPGLGQG